MPKLITLVEDRGSGMPQAMSALHGHYGNSYVLGVTGPPGAGKSTLLDCLITRFRAQGKRVGVVAVDPSSPFSGGAVLGDRIRMQRHYMDPDVFIRSLSARGNVGGLARSARDVARVLDAAGYDLVIIETVGVGQSECDIMRVADTVLVVLVPQAGDTIQAMKAGLLEVADIFVINKADEEGAGRIKAALEAMLELRKGTRWMVPVILTAALKDEGVDDLVEAIGQHRTMLDESGDWKSKSASGRVDEFLGILRGEIIRRAEAGCSDGGLRALTADVERGAIDPYGAALQVFQDEKFLRVLLGKGGETA